jgi:cell division protein FtsB
MLNFKSKKIILPLYFCLLSALLFPAVTQAELGGSGSTAARDAAAQKEAKERKLEKKKQEAEAKKSAETQQGQPAETQTPAEGQQQDKPAAQ